MSTSPAAPEPKAPEESVPDPEIELERTGLLFENAGVAQLVTVTNGLVLLYIVGGLSPPPWAIAWWLVAAAISGSRYYLARRFLSSRVRPNAAGRWRRLAIYGSAVAGLAWGGGGIAFMTSGSEATRLFTALVLAGMVAGAVPILSAVPLALRVYAAPVMGAILGTALVDARSRVDWMLALVAGLFLFSVVRSARHFYEQLDRSIRFAQRTQIVAARLDKARRDAESASRAKSQFLATVSHEIRTPMNGILGMAQLLLSPDLKESERRDYAQTILDSGGSLQSLLNDILDLSKIEAGRTELSRQVFAPEQLVGDIAALFAEPAAAQGLALHARWAGLAGALYWSDPTRLRQMLTNLVSNAIKFTPEGSVNIVATEIVGEADRTFLEFSVADSGIGIAKDKQEVLFKPFSQVDATSTRRYAGTGLGLSIVHNLAGLMGGAVGFTSEPERGSTFWLRVPAEAAERSDESGPSKRSAPDAPAEGCASTLARRILIAEDNLTNRKVIEAMLARRGCQIRSAVNGREAVDAVIGGDPMDLVFMDCQMPEMDGFEATARIRAWEKKHGRPRLPIVALTASAFSEDRERCLSVGMDDFLAKPLQLSELTAALDRWIAVSGKAPPPG